MDLEIRKHERFQQLEWRWERAGWAFLTLLVLAGLLGMLGAGPVSSAVVRSGAVTVKHDRITHHEADESVTFVFGPGAVEGGTITAELTGSWPAGVDLQGISPQPTEQRALPDGLVLEFAVAEPGEVEVSLTFRAQQHGTLDGDLTVGPDTVSFSQFVMP